MRKTKKHNKKKAKYKELSCYSDIFGYKYFKYDYRCSDWLAFKYYAHLKGK